MQEGKQIEMVTSSSSSVSQGKSTKKHMKNKKAAAELHEKLQLLRSITHSHAQNNASIILDATRYIQELKHKVEILDRETSTSQHSNSSEPSFPMEVNVETLEKGFLVRVVSAISSQALLCSVLGAFEELGLSVLEARVSCADRFQLQVIAQSERDDDDGSLDSQSVQGSVMQAIQRWAAGNDDQD